MTEQNTVNKHGSKTGSISGVEPDPGNAVTPVNGPEAGIRFATGPDGKRSSTTLALSVMAAALRPLDAALADAVLREKRWRSRYPLFVNTLVEKAIPSAASSLASARAGLQEAWRLMQWSNEGKDVPLEQAFSMDHAQAQTGRPSEGGVTGLALQTHVIHGQGPEASAAWTVPWQGKQLSGEALLSKIDDWQARHIIEASAARALRECANHPEWFDLSDRYFVLMGAGSEAGPLKWLTRWRANIIAIDVSRADVWQRIASVVKAGNARVFVPVSVALAPDATTDAWQQVAGVDLLSQTPQAIAWLQQLQRERNQPFDIASHAYLDGEKHVRITLAMDWVVRAMSESRADNSFAWMATPTDSFAVPQATAQQAMDAWARRGTGARLMKLLTRPWGAHKFFQPNVSELHDSAGGSRFGVVDSLALEQGPNYALAKRLQQWRAMDLLMQGRRVSLNIAPSTTTQSVIKNPALKAAFAGADVFDVEVFEPATTNALMAALWVHDLRCGRASATAQAAVAHPFELLMDQACHGGLWTIAYRARTVLPFAAALGWLRLRLR